MHTKTHKILVVLCFLLIYRGSAVYGLEILYPLYSYPNWYDPQTYIWDDIANANHQVDITAIINPANGPDNLNTDYLYGLSDLTGGGVNLLGYVFTDYGTRPLAEVKADIDKYYMDYVVSAGVDVSGIFFDEAATASDQALVDYYAELYAYAKTLTGCKTVVLNHGINTSEVYTQYSDINIIYEDSYANWLDYDPDAYLPDYAADQFGALVHSTSSAADMYNAIDLALARGIGSLFVTDDLLLNPWDSLPSYWSLEVDHLASISQVPEPATLWLLLLPLIGFYAGRKFRMRHSKMRQS